MNTLILVFSGTAPSAAEMHAEMVGEDATYDSYDKVKVDEDGERAYIYPLPGVEDEVFEEDWPVELIPEHPEIFALDYRDPVLAQRLVLHLARRFEFIVDTDHHLLLTSGEFLDRARADPTWVWVREVDSPYGDGRQYL